MTLCTHLICTLNLPFLPSTPFSSAHFASPQYIMYTMNRLLHSKESEKYLRIKESLCLLFYVLFSLDSAKQVSTEENIRWQKGTTKYHNHTGSTEQWRAHTLHMYSTDLYASSPFFLQRCFSPHTIRTQLTDYYHRTHPVHRLKRRKPMCTIMFQALGFSLNRIFGPPPAPPPLAKVKNAHQDIYIFGIRRKFPTTFINTIFWFENIFFH